MSSPHIDRLNRSPYGLNTLTKRFVVVLAVLGILLSFNSMALAIDEPIAPTGAAVIDYGEHNADSGLWIVQLDSPALVNSEGASWTADGRLNVHGADSSGSATRLAAIEAEQDDLIAAISDLLGRTVSIATANMGAPGSDETVLTHQFRYSVALNGVALELSPAEAAEVAAMDGVKSVAHDYNRYITTDAGPEWIGATDVWESAGDPITDVDPCGDESSGSCGEGVVVGIIDTGINMDHLSFADPGPVDGYDYTNPNPSTDVTSLNGRYGVCGTAVFIALPACNDKLIGAYDFTGFGAPVGFPEDENGHGTHTASTSAGNVIDADFVAPTVTYDDVRIAGVAPHANIIAYKSCIYPFISPTGTCTAVQLVAAIDQAVADEVDVINYSIGGGPTNPYIDDDSLAFLNANEAGIFVSASAGNDGPGQGTVGSPANAPWVMSVGASTHHRSFANALIGLSADTEATEAPSDADMRGLSITAGSAADLPIVWAGDVGFPKCAAGTPEAAANPFLPGEFTGEIVVCERGGAGRVQECTFVADAGAEGCVLINTALEGNSIVADPHTIPAVHLTSAQGDELLAWLIGDRDGNRTGGDPGDAAPATNPVGQIAGTELDRDPVYADIMAGFSSRGPNAPLTDVIKPDVTAPGVDILAAWRDEAQPPLPTAGGTIFNVISGTSMSSPHDAGAAALVRGLHPEWTPDQVKAALMTTSFTVPNGGDEIHPVMDNDGVTLADPFDMGAGRIDAAAAIEAGLLLDEAAANYTASDPERTTPGDPTTLNIASFGDGDCDGSCSWTRSLTSTQGTTDITWTATVSTQAGLVLSVSPAEFTISDAAAADIEVTADVSGSLGGWQFGQITLTPDDESIPAAHFPVAVQATGDVAVPTLPLHFHGNTHAPEEAGEIDCTGVGPADITACGGPFLLESDELHEGTPAVWGPIPQPTDGAAARNIYDPNWIWCLTDDAEDAAEIDCPTDGGTRRGATTLQGPMTVRWWASTVPAGQDLGQFTAPWVIRLWADGEMAYESGPLSVTPAQVGIPGLLEATVLLPEIAAERNFVLHVDVWSSTDNADEQVTAIFYDGTDPCPLAASEEACDSTVLMPVLGLGDPDPEPTPTPTPTPGPSDGAPTPTPTPTPGPSDGAPTPTPPTNLSDTAAAAPAPTGLASWLAALALLVAAGSWTWVRRAQAKAK